ncbi:MAG: RNA polymerase sigma factor [Acidimicrobiaceae bacterium]|nr:RNA polymerase sigma factor [Acidimicrobiaceae bacterium]
MAEEGASLAGGGETERRLVERLQAGDEQAFSAVVHAYHNQMIDVARTFVDSRAVAEEVVQDAWLGVVRGIERFAGQSSLRTWLFRIVINRARSTGAREHRQIPNPGLEPAEDPSRFTADGAWAAPLPHWSEQVEDRLAAEALTSAVHDAIATLPANQRQVVMLRDVQGLPPREARELLGLSEANQRVLLHRGRVAIRRAIERRVRGD